MSTSKNNSNLSEKTVREVFARDGSRCVLCSSQVPEEAHFVRPLLSLSLWSERAEGDVAANAVVLCDSCDEKLSRGDVSLAELRSRAGIRGAEIPEDLEENEKHDRWGNVMLPSGLRMRGPLFWESEVRAEVERLGIFDLYSPYTKYPRTPHLPWSPGVGKDDRVLKSVSHFEGKRVVVTEKMDGENSTIYRNYMHARSLDGRHHPSRDWLKSYAASWQYEIPNEWRFSGENMYAKHSIYYPNLESYFYLFSVWNERNQRLSWGEIEEWAKLLGLALVPVLYDGVWDEELIRSLGATERDGREMEGYVVSLYDSFPLSRFGRSIAKWVRKGHVQTEEHWMHAAVVPNQLRGSNEDE